MTSRSRKAASLLDREVDAAAHLEIDEAIREYLIQNATVAMLAELRTYRDCDSEPKKQQYACQHLRMVNDFQIMFRNTHPSVPDADETRLRMRLLQFSAVFAKRHDLHSIGLTQQSLEQRRPHRTTSANADRLTIEMECLKRHLQAENSRKHDADAETSVLDQNGNRISIPQISLLQTLPIFMALSAIGNALQASKITEIWMRLAAGYMTQAVMEEILIYGSRHEEIFLEAFAWDFDPYVAAKEGSDDWVINAMFLDEDEGFELWHDIRKQHLRAMVPTAGQGLIEHLQALRESELDVRAFEYCVTQFLEGLLRILPVPLLFQLESDHVVGVTEEMKQVSRQIHRKI